ncbi:mitoguardin isoform X1 [Bombus vancouverensis nearcticus]|uniref:Mitoguardin isoform X1 n=1 Tax=Bombus bifarius TaxID=103933 RepID=A0A6P8LW79_9HYME|nr:mitoguardin isoform X1 [Bombus vancouverensis nearcticus]XP_033302644.1 mitoguardin isoform X1 [Bombus bifarius]
MSIFNAHQFLGALCKRYVISLPSINLSRTQKIFIICLTGGSLLLGGLAQFLKRRRRRPRPSRRTLRELKQRFTAAKSSNFDVLSQASWARKSEASSKSHISDRVSLISSVPGGPDADVRLTPQQYGVLGLEALEKALYCWEDALTAFSSSFSNGTLALPSTADAAFTQDVQELLDMGYQIQNHAELLFIDQHSVLFRNEDEESIDSHKPSNIGSRISGKDKADAASSPESFESARDGVADLREFEEFSEFFPHFEKQKLYHAALKQHEDKSILCRRLHTELVKCGSDIEYLAKVHCLRQAYTKLFTISSATEWIADIGRQVISDLIMYADRDPKDYLMHYERMLEFLQEPSNHSMMEEELTGRGVKCINFYDVLIDFILLDAFEEVEKPPSSIKAILQNRWISASFRETAIGTAVWSVLMGKRQMLKYDKGFLAHFYSISEQISPVLVWGFLGPEGSLRSTCHYFRDQVIEFLVDIFNFFKVRYTTVDNLAEDILREMKVRVENINQRLSLEGC